MTEINEGKLTIVFSNSNWSIKKYDDCDTFTQYLGKTDNLKANDIIGIHNDDKVYLFEIKDYNNAEIENLTKWDYNINNLAVGLSQKIKDTLLGVMSTKRNEGASDAYWDSVMLKFTSNQEFRIIFWIDGDLARYSPNFRNSQISSILKRKLRCLNAKIIVTNSIRATLDNAIHEYSE